MIIASEADRKALIAEIYAAPLGSKYQRVDQAMTQKQRGSLHIWCDMMADTLNAAGHDMKVVLSRQAEIPWTMASFKERIWKPTLEAQLCKESTEDQITTDVQKVYQTLSRFFSTHEELRIEVPPWPSKRGG